MTTLDPLKIPLTNPAKIYPTIGTNLKQGDGIPKDVFLLTLQKLSPLEWLQSCELVCQNWKKIINSTSTWEILAKKVNFSLPTNMGEFIPVPYRNELCKIFHLSDTVNIVKNKENFQDLIKKICLLIKSKEHLVIRYQSYESEEAGHLRIHIIKIQHFIDSEVYSSMNPPPHRSSKFIREKMNSVSVTRKYQIKGKEKGDFKNTIFNKEGMISYRQKDEFSVITESENIPPTIVKEINKFICNVLDPTLPTIIKNIFNSIWTPT